MSRQEPSGQPHGPAAFEEQAELLGLRDQAGRTAAEAAQTLTELADRLDLARQPGLLARRLATDARHAAVRTLREIVGRITSQAGTRRRTVLAAIPALAVAVTVAVIVARQRAQ
jgi:hypothetical protein